MTRRGDGGVEMGEGGKTGEGGGGMGEDMGGEKTVKEEGVMWGRVM